MTRRGLEGPVIESRWSEIFHTHPDQTWGPNSLLYNGYPEGRWPGHGVDHDLATQHRGWRKTGTITLLPLCALIACSKVNYTFSTLSLTTEIMNVLIPFLIVYLHTLHIKMTNM